MTTSRGRVRVEQSPKRVRAMVEGQYVLDSRTPYLVWEKPHYPTYYFPVADVLAKLESAGAGPHSPSRGDAELLDVVVGETRLAGAALHYPDSPIEDLRGLIRFEWSAAQHWFEEDEEVFVHPRDPYKRVDILASSKHVQVEIDGVIVADSPAPSLLFETTLPTRYYLPKTHVRMDLLTHTDNVTHCPYKGQAEYWTVTVNGKEYENIAWSYRSPIAESQKIAGMICFYNEKVDLIVDGVRQDRPRSPFS